LQFGVEKQIQYYYKKGEQKGMWFDTPTSYKTTLSRKLYINHDLLSIHTALAGYSLPRLLYASAYVGLACMAFSIILAAESILPYIINTYLSGLKEQSNQKNKIAVVQEKFDNRGQTWTV